MALLGKKNPVMLPLLLTVTTAVLVASYWSSVPESVAIWWNFNAQPILYGPRWLGLIVFPVLELLIPYVIYLVACHDNKLQSQSGESAYAIANIIALPSVLLFAVFALVYLPLVLSTSQDFLPRIFTTNIATWALFWLGYNLQYVEPNTSIGVPVFFPISNEDCWKKTHEHAGIILMAFGIILFVFALSCPFGIPFLVITLVIWLGAYIIAVVNGYMVFHKSSHGSTIDGDAREQLLPTTSTS